MSFNKTSLLEICDFIGGSQPPKSDFIDAPKEGYIRLLQIRDFENDKKAIYIPYSKDLKTVTKSDVLLGRYGASVGKILTGKEGTYNVALMKVMPDSQKVHNRFLFYVLKSKQFQKYLKIISESRAAQAGFSKKDLSRFYFHLPDLYTQEKIYLQLDTIQKLIDNRIKSVEMLDQLIESIYFEMFGDPLKNHKKWSLKVLDDLKENTKNAIKAGPFGSALKKEYYVSDGFKIYGQEQVIRNDFEYGDYYIDELRYNKLKSCSIKPDDVLISLVGTFGKIAIVPKSIKPGIINPRLIKISFNKEIVIPIFFKQLFETNFIKAYLKNISKGGTVSSLNLKLLKQIQFPIPPIELQNRFSDIKYNIDFQMAKLEKSLVIFQSLFQAVLQNAFSPNTEIDEQPIFKELIKRLGVADIKGNKKRLQYLLELFEENKFDNDDDYFETKNKLFDLILAAEIEQKVDKDKIILKVK